MIFGKNGSARSLRPVLLCALVLFCLGPIVCASPSELSTKPVPAKKVTSQDDSFVPTAAADLALKPDNARKATALVDFVEGFRLEANAEMENALTVYQKVLNFEPGVSELGLRGAALLSQQADYPRAIDVLTGVIKPTPKDT